MVGPSSACLCPRTWKVRVVLPSLLLYAHVHYALRAASALASTSARGTWQRHQSSRLYTRRVEGAHWISPLHARCFEALAAASVRAPSRLRTMSRSRRRSKVQSAAGSTMTDRRTLYQSCSQKGSCLACDRLTWLWSVSPRVPYRVPRTTRRACRPCVMMVELGPGSLFSVLWPAVGSVRRALTSIAT